VRPLLQAVRFVVCVVMLPIIVDTPVNLAVLYEQMF
jgi:hypothetical protein